MTRFWGARAAKGFRHEGAVNILSEARRRVDPQTIVANQDDPRVLAILDDPIRLNGFAKKPHQSKN
jgi:hypothetical protein